MKEENYDYSVSKTDSHFIIKVKNGISTKELLWLLRRAGGLEYLDWEPAEEAGEYRFSR